MTANLNKVVLILSLLGTIGSAHGGAVTTLDMNPSADNSLFELPANASNGAGTFLFAGTINRNPIERRRGLIRFGLNGIPAGSVIQSASLTMTMSRTISGALDVSLHRATSSWGEGDSDATGFEGRGATAEPGDATWINRFEPGQPWQSPGGDYRNGASATASVGNVGSYTWASAELAGDVQRWIDTPSENFGWVILGDESVQASAKRFDSRESSQPPVLRISYVPGSAPPPSDVIAIPSMGWPAIAALVMLVLLLAGVFRPDRVD